MSTSVVTLPTALGVRSMEGQITRLPASCVMRSARTRTPNFLTGYRHMSVPAGHIEQVVRFNSLDLWIEFMNHEVGQQNWYIAGGFAAHMRIEAYQLKDAAYYAGIRPSIFPGDIEIGVAEQQATRLKARGKMVVLVETRELDVSVQPKNPAYMQTDLTLASLLSNTFVFKPASIVTAYQGSSNQEKKDKREIRVAMLKLIQAGATIDDAGVTRERSPTMMGQVLAGAFKLKKSETREKSGVDAYWSEKEEERKRQTGEKQ